MDIGTNWIRLVVCEQKNGDSVPQVLALVKRQSKGLRRGYVINLEETTQSIREALDDAERIVRSRIRKVIVGVGGLSLGSKTAEGGVVASRPDSEITESDLGRAVEASEAALTDMANKQILHRIPLSFKLDGEKVLGRPEGLRGSKLEVKTLFITGGTQHLRDMVRAAEEAVSELKRTHPRELAALRGIGLSGQMHGATLLDASDAVLRPCILWNDTRSFAEAAALDADPRTVATVVFGSYEHDGEHDDAQAETAGAGLLPNRHRASLWETTCMHVAAQFRAGPGHSSVTLAAVVPAVHIGGLQVDPAARKKCRAA